MASEKVSCFTAFSFFHLFWEILKTFFKLLGVENEKLLCTFFQYFGSVFLCIKVINV